MIILNNITKSYGRKNGYKTTALNNVSIKLESGSMTAIIGKSGCGKSTLLNVMSGLTRPDSGEYYYNDSKLSLDPMKMSVFRRNHIGMIVQNFALINNRTAYENIALAARKNSDREIEKLAQRMGIADKLDSFPFEMSGGECQRTAIIRALINGPDIILADEPTGALDIRNRNIIMECFRNINRSGKTVVIVTHDLSIAKQCDRIIQMSDGKIM